MNTIINEIKKRDLKKGTYSIVGTELRKRRMAISKTIEAVSYKVCSPSYLCKVERGSIVPNKQMLTELFEKLEIKQDRLKVLVSMEKKLDDSLVAFMYEDKGKLFELHKECTGFLNYRSQMIELIYYISVNEYNKADSISRELEGLVATMTNYDLCYFTIYQGILLFYQKLYNEAASYLENARVICANINCIRIISLYKFYCSFKCNSRNIFFDYNDALTNFSYSGKFSVLNNINYLYALNLICNNMYVNAKIIIEGIEDIKLKKTAVEYLSYKINPKYECSMNDYNSVRDFFKLIIIYKLKNDELVNYLEAFKNSQELEFSFEAFEYLVIPNIYDKYKHIEKIYDTNNICVLDGYTKEFLIRELSILSIELGKYKLFSKAYISIK